MLCVLTLDHIYVRVVQLRFGHPNQQELEFSSQLLNLYLISEDQSSVNKPHAHISAFLKIQHSVTFLTSCPHFEKLSGDSEKASKEPN